MNKTFNKAFTLIELLVVIAIIAILAAILFPVFAQAKLAAKKTQGLSQMKQIGTAVQIYATDFDDSYPTWSEYWYMYYVDFPNRGLDTIDRYWDAKLSPYVKNGKPETGDRGGIWKSPGAEYAPTLRSLGINQALIYDFDGGSSVYYRYINAGQIEDVANTVFVADGGTQGRIAPPHFAQGYFETWIWKVQVTRDAPWRYSKDGANYAWTDGHAKYKRGDEMVPTRNKTAWGGTDPGTTRCSTAKYFAPQTREKEYLRNAALASGVTCQP